MSVAELVPVIAGDMEVLAGHARSLDGVGVAVADIGARVHATWQGLGSVYRAPDAEQSVLTRAEAERGLRRFLGTGSRYYESITIRTTEGPVTYP